MKVNKLIKQLQKIEKINPEQEVYLIDDYDDDIFWNWRIYIDNKGEVILQDIIIAREDKDLNLLTKSNLEKLRK